MENTEIYQDFLERLGNQNCEEIIRKYRSKLSQYLSSGRHIHDINSSKGLLGCLRGDIKEYSHLSFLELQKMSLENFQMMCDYIFTAEELIRKLDEEIVAETRAKLQINLSSGDKK